MMNTKTSMHPEKKTLRYGLNFPMGQISILLNLLLTYGFLDLSAQKIKSPSQEKVRDTLWIKNLLKKHPLEFGSILADTQKLEVQILYTQIDRDKYNRPHFKHFSYHFKPDYYFYPASTVKLPLTALALEKIQTLKKFGIKPNTPMRMDSGARRQISELRDTTAENNEPSIAQYIRRILLVSDNDAYNRLYEFLGPDYINSELHRKGFPSARIIHRLEVGDDSLSARTLNPMYFLQNRDTLLKIPLRVDPKPKPNPFQNTLKGLGFYQFHGRDSVLIHKPFNFSEKNGLSLEDEQNILLSILFPSDSPVPGFNLSKQNRNFLLKYMSMFPSESVHPRYPFKKYPDNYAKFLIFGSDSSIKIPRNIRIFNKIGQAYGFLIDNAYIVDFDRNIEFVLSVVINTNTDQIYNDDHYAYSSLGFPFLRNLGKYIYDQEIQRKRKVIPNLDEFKRDYTSPDFMP